MNHSLVIFVIKVLFISMNNKFNKHFIEILDE